jgi:peptide/nickel transport system substrate-binding protein
MAKIFLRSLFIFLLTAGIVFALDYDPNGRLVLSLGGEVSVMNPILSTDTASSAIEGVIFSGLVKVDKNLDFVPDLAKSWKVSKSGLVWTFNLRKDVYWHDGRKFTADDVKFTFDTILNPKINSVRRGDYIIDGKPIKFRVIDKYTIKAILPKPFSPFLASAGMGILPKHLLEGNELDMAKFNSNPVGTGPFKFVEYKTGDHVLVRRNPDYYGGAPLLKEILFKIIPDENTALVALKSGEIDSTGIPAKDFHKIKGVSLFKYDALLYTYFGFNLKSPKFSDVRVRQALSYAVNRKQLIGLIFLGYASPAYAPSAPVSWAYSDDVYRYGYDPQKAKELLKEAGVRDLEFTVLVNHGNKDREKAATILQQQFKRVGVKMDIRVLEWSAMLKVINARKDPKDFDAVIIGWSLGVDPDSYSIWHSSQYPGGLNFIGYDNTEVDRLLEAGRVEQSKSGRKKIYAKMYREITKDAPYIFLWYPQVLTGVRSRVGGLSEPGPAGLFLDIEKVYIKSSPLSPAFGGIHSPLHEMERGTAKQGGEENKL